MRRNTDLKRNATSPWATEDQYALFRSYLDTRHADGGMADMDIFEFAAMIEETPIRSRVIEYTRSPQDGETGVRWPPSA
jgi:leucyl-tRNA---protein transferase